MSVDRLSAEDSLMLRGDERWPQDIGAVVRLDGTALTGPDGTFRIDVVRETIHARLHLAPRFRQIIFVPRRGLGGPLWIDAPDFDVNEHIREIPLAAPGGEAELLRAVEELRCRRLDRSRPLWEMSFLTGSADGRVVLFARWHHAIADGMAAMSTIGAFLDTSPEATRVVAPPWAAVPPPTDRELIADNLRRHATNLTGMLTTLLAPRATFRRLRNAVPALRELLGETPGPETSLHRLIGADRRLALIHLRLDEIRAIADGHDATINDVLLAVTAGGLRAVLDSRGELAGAPTLPIYVPVSLRRQENGSAEGNLIAQMVVPLPVGEADAGRRLREITGVTTDRKARARTSLGALFRGRLASAMMLWAIKRQRVSVVSANIAGPETPRYFAGARVLEVFPVVNLIGTVGLAVGAVSYGGTFGMCITADANTYPDLDVIADGVRNDVQALDAKLAAASGQRSVHSSPADVG
jgi:WS/DGAT/MGAT family acyltransferase